MLQGSHLGHEITQISRALSLELAGARQLGIKSLAFVLLELLDERVFHFAEEAAIELVPLGRLQVALLEDGGLAENVNLAADVQVPAVDYHAVVLLLARINFLHVVLGVFDDDLVRLSVQSVDDAYLITLASLDPPRFEAQELDVVYANKISKHE